MATKTKKRDREFLLGLMEKLMLVRKFEEKIQWLFAQGFVYGTE